MVLMLNTFVERVLIFSGFIDEYKEQFITNIKLSQQSRHLHLSMLNKIIHFFLYTVYK